MVAPRCNPARASICAIFTLPIEGQSVFSLRTTWPANSGNLFTGGCGNCTSAAGPCSSPRLSQEEIVAAVTRNVRAVCSRDQLRAALSSRMAMRWPGG